jgi:para-aminobenzoate synthetase component 1
VATARRLAGLGGTVFLDSAYAHEIQGRFSYLAADPVGLFEIREGQGHWQGQPLPGAPLVALRGLLKQGRVARGAGLPAFRGGAMGFLAYEAGRLFERQPAMPGGLPDAVFGIYDWVIAFDHGNGEATLMADLWPQADGQANRDRVLALLAAPEPRRVDAPLDLDWQSNFTPAAYRAAVARVIEAILAGDLFQANIAQRFTAALPAGFDPWTYYERLRATNPGDFAAFLAFGDLAVASSSPERFLKVAGDRVETRPIKGTIARDPDPAIDAARAATLLASEKDRAENVMIVDLLRNDLSRVCRPHTVEVPALCTLETYAGLHHLVSTVTGQLEEGRDALDAVAAAFPGGSITGAPKPQAMQVIAQIEQVPRGVYCGSIGYLGFDGSADFNIAIRTVTFVGGQASFHVGGGITALSDPAAEHEETLTKAARIFAASGARADEAAE